MSPRLFEITKAAAFDAAHYLDEGPADSRYRRLHGHSFRVEATLRGPERVAVQAGVVALGARGQTVGGVEGGGLRDLEDWVGHLGLER